MINLIGFPFSPLRLKCQFDLSVFFTMQHFHDFFKGMVDNRFSIHFNQDIPDLDQFALICRPPFKHMGDNDSIRSIF